VERDIENGGRISVPHIAILIPAEDYEEDWSMLEADYRRLFGEAVMFRRWTEPGDLTGYDLVSPLIAWGYQRDCPTWFALLDRMEVGGINACNPVRVLRWNSDKAYLAELDAAGIATVPTRVSAALARKDLENARAEFGTDILVIKPPISGGADGTFRLAASDPVPPSVAGKRMMIQPFLPSIAAEGEYSLFYFGGIFSHSIIKRPAAGDFRVQDQFGGYEDAVAAPDTAKALAEAALKATSAITNTGALAYARVDMLRDGEGNFRLMELELIEPSLFVRFAPDNGIMFARALAEVMSKVTPR
jgi:glutathione synthase/RimK-type ligase-like ATP-grasp enzyme